MGYMELDRLLMAADREGLALSVREELRWRGDGLSFEGGYTQWCSASYYGSAIHWKDRSERMRPGIVAHFDPSTGLGEISDIRSMLRLQIRMEIPDRL